MFKFHTPCKWCKSRLLFVQKWLILGKNRQNGTNQKIFGTRTCKLFLVIIFELVGDNVKMFVTDRQTDRQTNSLTPYTGVCADIFSKLNLLPPYLLRSQGD